jgi:hypothetical protein
MWCQDLCHQDSRDNSIYRTSFSNDCRIAACCNADCAISYCYAACHVLSVIMLSVVLLNVVMPGSYEQTVVRYFLKQIVGTRGQC